MRVVNWRAGGALQGAASVRLRVAGQALAIPAVDEPGLEEPHGGSEAAIGDDRFDALNRQDRHIALVGRAHLLHALRRHGRTGHRAQPDFQQAGIGRRLGVGRQVGRHQDAARFQPGRDAFEELRALARVEQELGDEQGRRAVKRRAGRQRFRVADVEGASVDVAVLLGAQPGRGHHAGRGLHRDEGPCREALGKEVDFSARARADAQHARVVRQRLEDRRHQQADAVPERGQLCPLLVVGGGLLVEGGFELGAVHG